MKKSKKIGFKITLTIENKGIIKIDTYIDTRVLTNIGNFLKEKN